MLDHDSCTKSVELSIERIALWYENTTIDESTRKKIAVEKQPVARVGIPILQRGLIWRPHQVELFWDSLLRGFPVGSLVLCRKIKDQMRESDGDITHHLLDGQQRCDAIRIGFTDPFAESNRDHQAPVLWLDINPVLPNGTTREYLARLTTLAHPWGYNNNDNAGRISAADMRKARGDGVERPSPLALSPYFSRAPVPMAWLTTAEMTTVAQFRDNLMRQLKTVSSKDFKWPTKTIDFLSNDDEGKLEQKLKRIMYAIELAKNITVVALMAPDGLLDETMRESRDEGLEISQNHIDISNISNIEHLFQRLNRQGTLLNGEELIYSMIKAYWPKLAVPVDKMNPKHMPASRAIMLAVRIATADDTKEYLQPALGISQIRALARKKEKDSRIIDFITGNEHEKIPFVMANSSVATWLNYTPQNPKGFLPIQITRFAMGSPDLYLLLLWIAHKTAGDRKAQEELAGPARALISWGHWFSTDKEKLANCLYAECRDIALYPTGTIKNAVCTALKEEIPLLIRLPTVQQLRNFVELPQAEIKDWDWLKLANDKDGQPDEERKNFLERVIFRIIKNRDMLLYAQRRYIADKFRNYDPSEKDMWEDYNCPWDYDHILAHYYTYYKQKSLKKFSSHWVNTIGNLRAWPAEENRSDQKDLARDKINTQELRQDSYLLTNEDAEIDAFSSGHKVIEDSDAARHFADACWARIVRIYGEWYDGVAIGRLLDDGVRPMNPV